MTKTIKGLAGACALLSMTATAAKATECWSPVQSAAARVRNLQSQLMDTTLRCQMVGVDITRAYNGFIRENRAALQGANAVLRARLGDRDYDHFVTELANGANHARTDAEACSAAQQAAEAGMAAAGDVETLLALESQFAPPQDLPGGDCHMSFASATTAAVVAATPLQ